MDEFKCARQQVSLAKFEARFNALIDMYPHGGPSTCHLWHSLWVRGRHHGLKVRFCVICHACIGREAQHMVMSFRFFCGSVVLPLMSCRVAAGRGGVGGSCSSVPVHPVVASLISNTS